MVMMDDERHRRLFNEARAQCLCKGKDKVATGNSYCQILKKWKCAEDSMNNCPLWVFVKSITKVQYGV